jgi:hypothetical protein
MQFRINAAIKMLFHKSPEIIRVVLCQKISFPIQAFIPMKDDKVFQADSFIIDYMRERLIPAFGAARNDRPVYSAFQVCRFNIFRNSLAIVSPIDAESLTILKGIFNRACFSSCSAGIAHQSYSCLASMTLMAHLQ